VLVGIGVNREAPLATRAPTAGHTNAGLVFHRTDATARPAQIDATVVTTYARLRPGRPCTRRTPVRTGPDPIHLETTMKPLPRNLLLLLALSTFAVASVGCNTMRGVGRDTEAVGKKIEKEADREIDDAPRQP
jgi:predicted small secreted protein